MRTVNLSVVYAWSQKRMTIAQTRSLEPITSALTREKYFPYQMVSVRLAWMRMSKESPPKLMSSRCQSKWFSMSMIGREQRVMYYLGVRLQGGMQQVSFYMGIQREREIFLSFVLRIFYEDMQKVQLPMLFKLSIFIQMFRFQKVVPGFRLSRILTQSCRLFLRRKRDLQRVFFYYRAYQRWSDCNWLLSSATVVSLLRLMQSKRQVFSYLSKLLFPFMIFSLSRMRYSFSFRFLKNYENYDRQQSTTPTNFYESQWFIKANFRYFPYCLYSLMSWLIYNKGRGLATRHISLLSSFVRQKLMILTKSQQFQIGILRKSSKGKWCSRRYMIRLSVFHSMYLLFYLVQSERRMPSQLIYMKIERILKTIALNLTIFVKGFMGRMGCTSLFLVYVLASGCRVCIFLFSPSMVLLLTVVICLLVLYSDNSLNLVA